MSELNNRQWALYNFLKHQDGWTMQYDIAFNLNEEYPCEKWHDFHNSKARMDMTADIRAINKSDVIQKMIIVSSKGVKIANEEEAQRYIKSQYASIFRRLARARKLERKAGLDGQLKAVFGSEREIVQAFSDSNEVGERWRLARKLQGWSQKKAVELLRQYTLIDEPMLSKIENGVCLPNSKQSGAFEKLYK